MVRFEFFCSNLACGSAKKFVCISEQADRLSLDKHTDKYVQLELRVQIS